VLVDVGGAEEKSFMDLAPMFRENWSVYVSLTFVGDVERQE
jgi:hypothetical protein